VKNLDFLPPPLLYLNEKGRKMHDKKRMIYASVLLQVGHAFRCGAISSQTGLFKNPYLSWRQWSGNKVLGACRNLEDGWERESRGKRWDPDVQDVQRCARRPRPFRRLNECLAWVGFSVSDCSRFDLDLERDADQIVRIESCCFVELDVGENNETALVVLVQDLICLHVKQPRFRHTSL
jgi:hypothetical protein